MRDTAYGTGRVRADLTARQIQVVAPAPQGPPPAGRFPKNAFTIDLVAKACRCRQEGGNRATTIAVRVRCRKSTAAFSAFAPPCCSNSMRQPAPRWVLAGDLCR